MSWRRLVGLPTEPKPEPDPQCPPDCVKCAESASVDPDYVPEGEE